MFITDIDMKYDWTECSAGGKNANVAIIFAITKKQFDNDIGLELLEQLVQNEMISLPIGLIDH